MLSSSTPAASQIFIVESEDEIVNANLSLSPPEDITLILYLEESSRGFTNLLLTHPTTPVRTPLRRHRSPFSGDITFSIPPPGIWI